MEDISIFTDKALIPTEQDLQEKLGTTYALWKRIEEMVLAKYPQGLAEWNFPGKNYSWSFRIKDKRRAIIYFLPRDSFFKVAFVFGDKAVAVIDQSPVADFIKTELALTRKYAEGRGIQITIRDDSFLPDIDQLIDIKLNVK